MNCWFSCNPLVRVPSKESTQKRAKASVHIATPPWWSCRQHPPIDWLIFPVPHFSQSVRASTRVEESMCGLFLILMHVAGKKARFGRCSLLLPAATGPSSTNPFYLGAGVPGQAWRPIFHWRRTLCARWAPNPMYRANGATWPFLPRGFCRSRRRAPRHLSLQTRTGTVAASGLQFSTRCTNYCA